MSAITSDAYVLKNNTNQYYVGRNRWSKNITKAKLYNQDNAMYKDIKAISENLAVEVQPVKICIREVGKLSNYEDFY